MPRILIAVLLLLMAAPGAAQTSLSVPIFQAIDNNGNPCTGCKLRVFQSGTQTAVTTYSDTGLTVPNTFPVVLDANGRAAVFVTSTGVYDLRLDGADDVVLWRLDGYQEATPLSDELSSTGNVTIRLDNRQQQPGLAVSDPQLAAADGVLDQRDRNGELGARARRGWVGDDAEARGWCGDGPEGNGHQRREDHQWDYPGRADSGDRHGTGRRARCERHHHWDVRAVAAAGIDC